MDKKLHKNLYIVFFNLIAILIIIFSVSILYLFLVKNKIMVMPDYLKKAKPLTFLYKTFFLNKTEKKLVAIMDKYDTDIMSTIINKDNRWYMNHKLYDFMYMDDNKTKEKRYFHKSNMVKLSFRFPVSVNRHNNEYYLNLHTVNKGNCKSEIESLARETLSDYQYNSNFLSALVNFDQYGFRKTGISNDKKLPVILFVGDSFTEGLYIADDKTFAHVSGVIFYDKDFGYSVNGGVNGYSAFEIPYVLENFADKINPKMVVFTHSPADLTENDNETNDLLSGKISFEDKFRLWNENYNRLNKIYNYCIKKNISFVITLYPDCSQIINYGKWGDSRKNFQEKIKNYCKNKNILCLDFYDQFVSETYNDINKRLNLNISMANHAKIFKEHAGHEWDILLQNYLYIIDDGHLSEYGHKLYGELIAGSILKNYRWINNHYEKIVK